MPSITQKLSYGMYVVSTMDGKRPTGCICNTAVQITSSPATIAISMNHDNYTNGCIKKAKKFAISILDIGCDPSVIGVFGFNSGKSMDKFDGVQHKIVDGMPVVTNSCGYIVCEVVDGMETSSHTVFLGKVVASELFRNTEPMTYDYYHRVIKGSSPKNAPTFVAPEQVKEEKKIKKFVCPICGYEYEGEEVPDGFECPICGCDGKLFKEVK